MENSRRKRRIAASCLILAGVTGAPAVAGAAGPSIGEPGSNFVLANAERFCEREPVECALEPGTASPEIVAEIAGLLSSVNRRVNATTAFRLDRDQYGASDFWTIPESGFGDCEDYALAKRKLLIEAGVDPRNLRITLVRFFEAGKPVNHALLGVVTDLGLRFLDMNETMIADATAFTLRFGYRFEALQTASDFTVYEPMRQPVVKLAESR